MKIGSLQGGNSSFGFQRSNDVSDARSVGSSPVSLEDSSSAVPLLENSDPVDAPLKIPKKLSPQGYRGWCKGYFVRVVKGSASAAVTAVSLFLRVKNYSYPVQVLSSIGIGVGFQCMVNTCVKNKYTSRVQQVALSVFGSQTGLYAATQIWNNVTSISVQTGCTSAIGIMAGVALTMYAKEFIQNNFIIRKESGKAPQTTGVKFEKVFIPEGIDIVKGVAAVACAVGWYFAKQYGTYVHVGMASFQTLYYATEIVGQRACSWLEQRIQTKTTKVVQRGFTEIKKSWELMLQIGVNTIGFFALPLSWVPWAAAPQTEERSKEMWVVGLLTGLFSGFAYRTQETRFQEAKIDQLDELQPRTPLKSLAFKAWRVSWPAITMVAFTYFSITQWASSDDDVPFDDKLAMASNYLGVVWTLSRNLLMDKYWSLPERIKIQHPTVLQRLKDRIIIAQNLPRLLGINPLYVYFLWTNLMSMQSGQDLNTSEKAINCAAWFFYGKGMANEFWQTWSERRGSIFAFPMMMMMNAAYTLRGVWKGKGTHD